MCLLSASGQELSNADPRCEGYQGTTVEDFLRHTVVPKGRNAHQ